MRLPALNALVGTWKQKTLGDILDGILPGTGAIRTRAERHLKGKLKSQQARTAGTALAGATLKLVEDAMHPDTGLSDEARVQIGQALANNAAVQYCAAGQALLNLAAAQAALELARDTDREDAARMAREAAEEAYERTCINVGRAAAGDGIK